MGLSCSSVQIFMMSVEAKEDDLTFQDRLHILCREQMVDLPNAADDEQVWNYPVQLVFPDGSVKVGTKAVRFSRNPVSPMIAEPQVPNELSEFYCLVNETLAPEDFNFLQMQRKLTLAVCAVDALLLITMIFRTCDLDHC